MFSPTNSSEFRRVFFPAKMGRFRAGRLFFGSTACIILRKPKHSTSRHPPPVCFFCSVCAKRLTSGIRQRAFTEKRYSGSQMAVLIALGWAFTEEAASITPLAFALHSSSIYLISLKTFRERKERDPSCPACTAALGVELGTSLPRSLLPAPIHVS